MKQIPDKSIDIVVTSPPYDNLREYKGYSFNFEGIAQELWRVIKDGGVVVWVVGDATVNGSETGTSFRQALYFKEIGFNLHDTMIWRKNNFSNPSNNRYHQIFEYMFIFSKDNPKTFNAIKDRKNVIVGERKASPSRMANGVMVRDNKTKIVGCWGMRYNLWKIATTNNEHPAPFPGKLAQDHILSWSNKDDLVLDPMCGSGTTCVAAKMLDRRYIGIEISEEYCEIARKRIENTIVQGEMI